MEGFAGPADYALFHGLTISHLTNAAHIRPRYDVLITKTLADDDNDDDAFDTGALPNAYFRAIISKAEIIAGYEEATKSLLESCLPLTDQDYEGLVSRALQPARETRKQLGLERPLLRSDHSHDYKTLSRRVEKTRRGPLPCHNIPLEPADDVNDGGLRFPRSALELDRKIMSGPDDDKTSLDKAFMEYLHNQLEAKWTEIDQEAMMESAVDYRGLKTTRKLTPPLTPTLEPYDPFIPDSKTFDVPIPSDPSSRLSDDIKAMEEKIFEDDNTCLTETKKTSKSPPFQYEDLDVSAMIQSGDLSSPKVRPSSLKIELPLLAPDSDGIVLSPRRQLATARELIDSVHESKLESNDEEMKKCLQEIEEKTMRRVEQEKLNPVDATARIPIPIMDFKTPDPDWYKYRENARGMARYILSYSGAMTRMPQWPRDKVMEQNMAWVPVPTNSARMLWDMGVSETIDVDQHVLESFLQEPREKVQTSADFVPEQKGPAILRYRFDDDDDLSYSSPPRPTTQKNGGSPYRQGNLGDLGDLGDLVKKRRRIIEEQDADDQPDRKKTKVPFPGIANNAVAESQLPRGAQTNIIRSGSSNTEELLAGFLETRGKKLKETTQSSFFAPRKTEDTEVKTSGSSNTASEAQTAAKELMPPPPKPLPPPPAPNMNPPVTNPKVIASIALPSKMWTSLTELLPGIQIIERNYEAYNSNVWRPGSVKPAVVQSSLTNEADIIISPATGLLFRPLIKLRQKAGAGASGKPLFWSQIERISARYEHLIILVSEASSRENENQLLPSDAKALAEFQGFVAGLPTDVSVFYLGGGAGTQAKWAAAMVAKYAAEGAKIQDLVVQPETWWELFLRRAGLNVYAAQTILSLLREPDAENGAGGDGTLELYGLPRLLQMTLNERVDAFQEVMGGRRVIEMFSRVVDANWVQARGVDRAGPQRP